MRDYFDWVKEARCAGSNYRRFFPTQYERKAISAKVICEDCPVKRDCLDHAIIYLERGIWGGTTENARKSLIRENRSALVSQAKLENIYHDEFINYMGPPTQFQRQTPDHSLS